MNPVLVLDPVAVETENGKESSAGASLTTRAAGRKASQSLEEKRRISMELTKRRAAQANDQWRAALETHPQDKDKGMGALERRLLRQGRELQRAELERMLQKEANETPPICPICGRPLQAVQWREISILSRFGPVNVSRAYGYCDHCRCNYAPADYHWKIGAGKNSPEMAEQLQLLGTIAPPEQAERLSIKLYGFQIDDSRIARELERAGLQALEERERLDEKALTSEGAWEITRQLDKTLPEDFIMIIQADAFLTRERDDWGQSEVIRDKGGQPERWHNSKVGTIFLLQDRVRCGGKTDRPVILRRAYVATRGDAFEFGKMIYAEAVRYGLLRASQVYFISDGAVWLWNIQQDRFPQAIGTLDAYHAAQHIWAVARARYGEGEKAKEWAEALVHQLHHGGDNKVLKSLKQLAEVVEKIEPEKRNVDEKAILREWEYFNCHRGHFDYATKSERGIPIGSGCIESTCKQFQLRVKRCGQFWTTDNLDGLLCLYSRYLSYLWN
ncbi:MAG: hypothetical protein NTX50_05925 [Candidatus Sumerlaeota bacterium]|nr:hypothetical protein [Candidatus Sumerlaeota bacterium]